MGKKQKTKKTLKKRIRLTRTGKILKKKLRTSHLKSKWTANRKHRKAGTEPVQNKKLQKKLRRMLGK